MASPTNGVIDDATLLSLHFCTQIPAQDAEAGDSFPLSNLKPVDGSSDSSDKPELAMSFNTFWPNPSTLRTAFLRGGSPDLRLKVQNYALLWNNYSNVKIEFVDIDSQPPPVIRIAFDKGGSWSLVGTNNLSEAFSEPTMNFGWLVDGSSEESIQEVVLHEFGHALGCIHEQQSPSAKILWNIPAVYQYYRTSQNPPWDEAKTDRNVLNRYDPNSTNFTIWDTKSIMQYYVPPQLTLDGSSIPANSELSDLDKTFIAMIYPQLDRDIGFYDTATPGPTMQANTKNFYFDPQYNATPNIAIGLTRLDVDKNANLRLYAQATSLQKNKLSMTVGSWDNTKLWGAAATWFTVPRNDPDFQVGSYTYDGQNSRKPVITFKRPFPSFTPKIVLWISRIDSDKNRNCRLNCVAENITTNSFTLSADGWDDTRLYGYTVSWIAYPSEKPGVASGESSFAPTPPSWFTLATQFPPGAFTKPPKVFMALSYLDLEHRANARLTSRVTGVTPDYFTYQVFSWDNSTVYGVKVQWIAIAT